MRRDFVIVMIYMLMKVCFFCYGECLDTMDNVQDSLKYQAYVYLKNNRKGHLIIINNIFIIFAKDLLL